MQEYLFVPSYNRIRPIGPVTEIPLIPPVQSLAAIAASQMVESNPVANTNPRRDRVQLQSATTAYTHNSLYGPVQPTNREGSGSTHQHQQKSDHAEISNSLFHVLDMRFTVKTITSDSGLNKMEFNQLLLGSSNDFLICGFETDDENETDCYLYWYHQNGNTKIGKTRKNLNIIGFSYQSESHFVAWLQGDEKDHYLEFTGPFQPSQIKPFG